MRAVARQALNRILVILLCIWMIMPYDMMTAVANGVLTENDTNTIMIENYQLMSDDSSLSAFDDGEDTSKILELKYDETVTQVRLYYRSGNNWIDISESDQDKLPADAEYQFEILYNYVSSDELIAAGGRMVYRDFPDWFVASGKSQLLYEGEAVALVEEIDGEIVITFDMAWLANHKGRELGGSFKINAKIDWHDIPEDENDRKIPGLNVVPNFEGDLAQKYGSVSIDKNLLVLEDDDGKYYLKYTLTVKNMDTVAIPDVSVKDIFENAAYIERYVGVETSGTTLPQTEDGSRDPWENCNFTDASAGKLSGGGGEVLWKIGDLLSGETRVLTYYVQIAESYVDNVTSNPINNRANVYSGDVLKDTDAESFQPKNDITLEKQDLDIALSPQGNGTISYQITITADESNSFQLNGLTLKDSFPEELSSYLSGSNGAKMTVTVEHEGESPTQTVVDYKNASFALNDLYIAPGETVTVTYTVTVENIFLADAEEVELINIASLSSGDRVLRETIDTVTLDKHTWLRKIVGAPQSGDKTVQMLPSDGVYEYDGTNIRKSDTPDEEFVVPDKSLKYQVVLNETGQWDLSTADMTDRFSSTDHINYVGYVKIQIFERAEGASDNLSNGELIAELEGAGSAAVKTVWLKVDGMGSFSFQPSVLGIEGSTKYTYLLTYYGEMQDMSDVTQVQITNNFHIEGTVGVGDGNIVDLPGVEVSVGKMVQGSIGYNATKTSWYYTPAPVHRTVDPSIYLDKDFTSDYKDGAFYWVIRLEGDLAAANKNENDDDSDDTKLTDFYVRDKPAATSGNTGMQFKRDSVVGVYVGDKDFDITAYSSFPEFAEAEKTGLTKLEGNPQNDKFFPGTKPSYSDYQWFAMNENLEKIQFSKRFINGYDKDTQAIYIVLRTIPTAELPTAKNTVRNYKNNIYLYTKKGEIFADDATYTHEIRTAMMKESKGAYIFDKDKGTFTNCSNRTGGDWYPKQKIFTDQLPSSGIYAAWLLNVNNNGTLSGTYDIIDHLPKGMKLVYVDVNNFGNAVKKDPSIHPKTEYIQELNNDSDWKELETANPDDINNIVKVITYYNEKTNEIRWRISNFTSSSTDIRREINLRIICKVEDPELVLNQYKNYENTADLVAHYDSDYIIEKESADVAISLKLDKDFDREYLAAFNLLNSDGTIRWPLSTNQIAFKIDINPYGDDLCDGDTLPTLIDMLSNMELIENSISVVILDGTENGTPYTDFTYDVTDTDDGQMLTVVGLPDGLPLRLKYKARMVAIPKQDVAISNIAYWAGYDPPGSPQVSETGSYNPEGDVFTQDAISITINKVDADSHSKKLNGAEFVLYEVDTATSKETAIGKGVSDSMGNVKFTYEAGVKLRYDTVYCIEEVTAPEGYTLDTAANRYYFLIVPPNSTLSEDALAKLKKQYRDLDIWYDSPEYSIVIENKKAPISVRKCFVDKDGNEVTPTSGKYKFGLFTADGKLLETLTIEYTESGARYYLDGVEKSSPRFTNYDPETIYQVYELDENDQPIKADRENKAVLINGIYYKVEYSGDVPPDNVKVNSQVVVTNTETDPPEEPDEGAVTLPSAGGTGTGTYYIAGCILMLLALFFFLFMRRCYEPKNKQN